jgi:membrane protein YdbS with pleckstrin-like domain
MADKAFKVQVLETITALMTAAFGLIAALAWNEAIKSLINDYFESGSGTVPLLVYAVIVTIVAILAILMIARSLGRLKSKMEKNKKE